jgi:hypothetical protein
MELIASIGVVLLMLQASISIALRMRLRYAPLGVQLPRTIRSIVLGCIGVLFANSLFNVLWSGIGHFTTCLSFSLTMMFLNNETLVREMRRSETIESNLAILKKQADNQQEVYNALLKNQTDASVDAEVQVAKDKVQEKVRELEVENKQLADGRSA